MPAHGHAPLAGLRRQVAELARLEREFGWTIKKGVSVEDQIAATKGKASGNILHDVRYKGKSAGKIVIDARPRGAWQHAFVTKVRQDQTELWKEVRYVAFDAPGVDAAFEARLAAIRAHIERHRPPYLRAHTGFAVG